MLHEQSVVKHCPLQAKKKEKISKNVICEIFLEGIWNRRIRNRTYGGVRGRTGSPRPPARLKLFVSVFFNIIAILKSNGYILNMRIRGIIENGRLVLDQNFNWPDGTEVTVDIHEMDEPIELERWKINRSLFYDLTPIKVRSLLIRCFLYVHLKEIVDKKEKRLTFRDYEIGRQAIIAEVQLTFKQLNFKFEAPDKEGLFQVLNLLAEKQINRGFSEETVLFHKGELLEAISYL